MSDAIIAEAQRRMARNKKARMRVFCHEILTLAGVAFDAPVAPAPAADIDAPAEPDGTIDATDEGGIYDGMTNAELRAECENRGLSTSGNKADLIARLEEHDASPPDDGE